MKIAILGDSHDQYDHLHKAVQTANEQGCELMLHTGDLGAPKNSISILEKFVGPVRMILGNNDHEIIGLMTNTFSDNNFTLTKDRRAGDALEEEFSGVKVFMHHYPRIAELAALSGEYDLCIHGHTHLYRNELVGSTVLLNPGSIIGEKEPASMVVFDVATKKHEHIIL